MTTSRFVGDTDAVLGEVEEFLTGARHRPELDRVLATVLFTDIVQSTDRAAEIGDRRWRDLLDRHDEIAREQIDQLRGRFVKSTGDGVVATFDGPARGIRCAQGIVERTKALGLDVRAGLHTGEVEIRGDDLHGLAVHVAQRVSSIAGAGEVLVSRTVVDLVAGSDIEFADHGEHELKGVPAPGRCSGLGLTVRARLRGEHTFDTVEPCGEGAWPLAYAELHCHTNFSFLDGASHPEELVEEAHRLGLAALAVTDHDGFYGWCASPWRPAPSGCPPSSAPS